MFSFKTTGVSGVDKKHARCDAGIVLWPIGRTLTDKQTTTKS